KPRPRDVVDMQMNSSSRGSAPSACSVRIPHPVALASPMPGPKMDGGFEVSRIAGHHEGGDPWQEDSFLSCQTSCRRRAVRPFPPPQAAGRPEGFAKAV